LRPSEPETQTLAIGEAPVFVAVTEKEAWPPGATCEELGAAEIVIDGGGATTRVLADAPAGGLGLANPLAVLVEIGRFVSGVDGARSVKVTVAVPERSGNVQFATFVIVGFVQWVWSS
jgi:hypothetical protein